MITEKEIVKRFKECVENSDLSYVELEKKTGISKSSLQRYVSGQTKKIPVDAVQAVAKAVGASAKYIMGWEDDAFDVYSVENIIPMPKTRKIPLLGTIACGEPILATENIEDNIDIPEHINADFALRCKSDSMINARICDGDVVYIRQQPDVENGEIAAVLIDDEATLKRVYKSANQVILQAENPAYPPMVFTEVDGVNVRILGKAVGFTSKI